MELRVVCECVYEEEDGVTLLVDAGRKPGEFLFYPLSWWQEGTVVTSASQFGSGGVAAARFARPVHFQYVIPGIRAVFRNYISSKYLLFAFAFTFLPQFFSETDHIITLDKTK